LAFRERPPQQWKIVEKDIVDEIIFRTMKPRNRIMLELMARGGMRVGNILKIRPMDIQDRKITLAGPKSGKKSEVVFIPQKVADRLKEHVKESGTEPEERLFPICYNAARIMVRKPGRLWSASMSVTMTCDGMRPPSPPDPARRQKSSAR
jgi:integrase